MRSNNYVPPNVLPRPLQLISPILKQKWIRQLILLPSTLTGKRFSNKTEDYGVFKPSLISHLDQLSIYVRSIDKSRAWYEELAGMTHSRTCEREPHPFKKGYTIRCCYMNCSNHEECLVLIEEYDKDGQISIPSGMSFFHFALEIEGNQLHDVVAFAQQAKLKGYKANYGVARHNDDPPLGDGETGGNVAVYFYDPDYNNVEFCGAMDTIENYRTRIQKA
ncbi:MAG: VOC family protein [Bacteroidetes bacterium]|nr:VOC family protein [Bacteroidota bacterium]